MKTRRFNIEIANFSKKIVFDFVKVTRFHKMDMYTFMKKGRLTRYSILICYMDLSVEAVKIVPDYDKYYLPLVFKTNEKFDEFVNKFLRAIEGDESTQQYMCRELFG